MNAHLDNTDERTVLERQADSLVGIVEDELELMRGHVGYITTRLYDYVYSRELRLFEGENAIDQLSEWIMMLGGVTDFVTENRYLGLTPRFLENESPLKTLLHKAEVYMRVDFPDFVSWEFYSANKEELHVFSLEEIAELSGRTVGSIRNAAMKGGDLKTVKIDNVLDFRGEAISQSVFVEYIEARRWLEKKNCYEPLKGESVSDEARIEFIRNHGPKFDGGNLPQELLLRDKGQLQVYYAPFEYINRQAKIVLCGITPGAAQAEIALNTLSVSLGLEEPLELGLQKAKQAASFAGSMRGSLSKMLDHVGINTLLGISSCSQLFGSEQSLVHYTSALKNPVFYKGGNYTGNPLMLKESALKWQIDEILKSEVEALGADVIYIPLGPKPAEALFYLAQNGLLKQEQILAGVPHPSGANAERIKYFCEEKEKQALSSRTNADVLDESRERIKAQVAALMSQVS